MKKYCFHILGESLNNLFKATLLENKWSSGHICYCEV